MNNTHGDILHTPNSVDGLTTNNLFYRQRPEDTTGGASSIKSYGEYNPPRGEVGWICPVCGRGLAPSTSYCPCNSGHITYLNGGLSIQDISIDCKPTTPPEAYYTTTATTATNKCNDGVVYGAHYDMHN